MGNIEVFQPHLRLSQAELESFSEYRKHVEVFVGPELCFHGGLKFWLK